MSHLERFGLRHAPLPRDACGPSFHEARDGYARLARVFHWLADEPGLGLLVGDAGVGKTAALRHLCAQLPRPQYRVIYLCDSALSPKPSSTTPSSPPSASSYPPPPCAGSN